MKKLILLILILTFSSIVCDSDNSEDSVEKYYNYTIELLKGMSDSSQTKCSDFLDKQRKIILPLIKGIVGKMDEGEKFEDAIPKYGIKLLSTPGFAQNCNLLNAIPLYFILSSPEKIKDIGKTIKNNSKTISQQKQIINNSKSPETLIAWGKILSTVLNFTVH